MEIIKKVLLYIILGTILSIVLNSLEFNSNVENSTVNNESLYNSPIVDYSLSNDSIKYKEKFKLKIEYDKNHTLVESKTEISGFSLSNEINKINQNSLEFELLYESPEDIFEFTANLVFQDGNTYRVSVFGFLYDETMFLSDISQDQTILKAYNEDLENNNIDQETYEILVQELSNEAISNESITNIEDVAVTNALISGNTYIIGTLEWEDDNGNSNPLQFITVEIWDDDTLFDEKLGTVTTDIAGDYSFEFNNVTFLENGGYDLFLKVYSKGKDIDVTDGSSTYKVTSSVVMNVATGSTTNISIEVDMSNDTGRAFQVAQALITGNRYVNAMGSSISDVDVIYPGPNPGSSYSSSTKEIFLGANDYLDWDNILHEYGHHIQHEFDFANSPGGSHTMTQNLSVVRSSKDEGTRLAWGESWPTVYALQVTYYYASDLANIDDIADEFYDDTIEQTIHYNIEIGDDDGESQEAAIMAVLFDMYDSGSSESFDTISLSHQAMWNLIINSDAETFSDFVNRVYDTQTYTVINGFASLIEEYGMAPNNLSISGSISITPSTFSWNEGGSTSSSLYENDEFDLIFYDESYTEYYRIEGITATTYTPSTSEWHSILDHYGNCFYVRVAGYETNSPVTGGYITNKITLNKGTIETLTDSFYFSDRTRYHEEIIELYPTQDKEFTITFETSGKKIIQTFGAYNVYMYIYDTNGVLLTSDYNDGYLLNSFITFESDVNTTYIIRVRFASTNQNGQFKLGIYPTIFSGINDFEDIYNCTMPTSITHSATLFLNSTDVFSLTITETRSYTLETHQYNDGVDTYLYIIDVTNEDPFIANDDGGVGLYSKITTTLESGHTYLIIVAAYNITTQSGQFNLTIKKD
jgi:hypothetical protein